MNIFNTGKNIINWMHQKGIPIILFRDPLTEQPSFTLTMALTSFLFCLVGLFQKLNNTDLDIDMSQALWLLTITSGLYLGRRVTGNSQTKDISVDKVEKEKES